MFLYFEQCQEWWGGSPATNSISSGIETSEINEQTRQTNTEDADISATETSEQEEVSKDPVPDETALRQKQRRDLLQVFL